MPLEILEFDGRNALRSQVSPFEPGIAISGQYPNTVARYPFVDYFDLITDGAWRIRKRLGKGAAIGSVPAGCVAIHEFERVDPTTGVVTFYQFAATAAAIYRWNGASFAIQTLPITPGGSYWQFINFENRCFALNGKDAMIVFDGTSWRLVGQTAPPAAPTYTLAGTYSTGTVTTTNGSAVINGIGTTWDFSGAWSNKYIDINGIRYKISNVTNAGQLQLTESFKEVSIGGGGAPYSIYFGVMDWVNPPKYAAAYYNPTTGHCSEASPVAQLTEQNQAGTTPTITLAGSTSHTAAFNNGYTQFKLFRSYKNGAQMLGMGVVINNNNSGAAIVMPTSGGETATTGPDTILTGGSMPIATNVAPPAGLGSLASWQGRLWAHHGFDPVNSPPDSPRTFFCLVAGETPIGVAEECWDRRNERHGIPQPKGLVSIGGEGSANGLIIQSSDGDYTLDGYDNLTFTNPYRRVPTRRSGCFQFGAIDVDGALLQLYRDKRLLLDDRDLGEPIQDKLNLITASAITGSRLQLFAYELNDLILITIPKAAGSNNDTLVIDRDHARMDEWGFGFSASGVVHGTDGSLQLWIGDTSGNIFRLLQNTFVDGVSTQYQPFFRTGPIHRTLRSQLRRVHIFVGPLASNPAALTWQLTYRLDGDQGAGTTVNFQVAATDHDGYGGLELYADFETPVIFNTVDLKVTFPSTATDLYVEKMLVVIDDAQSTPTKP